MVRVIAALLALMAPHVIAQDDDLAPFTVTGSDDVALTATPLAEFDSPWAMTFLPDGRSLVTQRIGGMWLVSADGEKLGLVGNIPEVTPRNQGGLGDIVLDPDFANNSKVYVSYAARDADDPRFTGAIVERATLALTDAGGALENREIIWRQAPLMRDEGHYGHRMAFAPDGTLFITSGDRRQFTVSQNMAMNLGKVVRINTDGSAPEDNPFFAQGGVTAQIWSLGHRNALGIAFDAEGRLWSHEMGPRHGDELNLIERGDNYGYPHVSDGVHYSGTPIPDHDEIPIYAPPAISWVPAISPAGFIIYDGSAFSDWSGNGFIGGLSSMALIRVTFEGRNTGRLRRGPKSRGPGGVEEAARYAWDRRIREVEQGPDGAIYVLEDQAGGRLIRLTPAD